MSKTILLIEDNADVRENAAEILGLADYNVITAANGKEGVRLAQTENPDLIVCDIMMPELDGYGVLHMLSKSASTVGIPFIFLTAKSEKEDFRKGMTMGADDYITKPFTDVELLDAVEMRFRKSEILRAEFEKTAEGLNQFMNHARGLEELKKLSQTNSPRKYSKRDDIYLEGNFPSGLYFVQSGKVKIHKSNADAKSFVTELYNEGDFFGYHALLENSPYGDSATVLEDSEIITIPKDDFFALLFSNRDVAAKFIKLLSGAVIEKEERLLNLAYNSVRKRVAQALVTLQDRYQTNPEEPFSMAIPREDLASIVGTATETVIRTLSDFKDEGLINIKGSTITIANPAKLASMRN